MWWSTVVVIVALALSDLVAPRAVHTQPAHVPRIGVLAVENRLATSLERFQVEFREALRERGYVEGQHVLVDYRWGTAGQTEHLNTLAEELARLPVDLLIAMPTPAAHAAKRATLTIPIVFNAGDPVGTGLVASLARPGGNATGVGGTGVETSGKYLELLRELLPTVTRVAVLSHTTDPFARPFLESIETAAQSLDVRIQSVVVRGAEECDKAFTAMVHERAEAVIIQSLLGPPRAAELAVQHHLPAISVPLTFAEAGGLMTYASNRAESWRKIASYVDKILKGAKPADLPVERATKFDLVINLKTAQTLGITIPPSLLFQADRVIR
jgi:putative ABC transport system substrate-binding protein